MAPQEMGGRSSEKSTFAATCSLLSQYIKEKGSIANLGPGVVPPFAAPEVKSEEVRESAYHPHGNVMELFPQRAGFGPSNKALTEEGRCCNASVVRKPERAPLTIFYGGKVLVFDNYPAGKARDLMQLASKGASTMQNSSYVPLLTSESWVVDHPTGLYNQNPKLVSAPMKNSVATHSNQKRPVSDLPIARKSSLGRFIEKRKDRISATSPYKVNDSPVSPVPVKVEERELWLDWGQ